MPDASTLSSRSAADIDRLQAAIARVLSSTHPRLEAAATLAQAAQLNSADWQALVKRWAGVSAEQFWRSLTREATQARLAASRARCQAAPGESRFAAPPVRLTEWSPGTARDAGGKLAIAYGLHDTQFGLALIAAAEQGLCMFQFCTAQDSPPLINQLREKWPQATLHHAPERTRPYSDRLNQVGSCAHPHQPLDLLVRGTPFQIRVWRALLTLPLGSLATYQDLADRLGNAKAARAVGAAVGANPIAYWIPCHRVIRATGDIGGYRWAPWRKAAMLGWEACQRPEGD